MNLRQEKNLSPDHPLRSVLKEAHWPTFTWYSIEIMTNLTDKNVSITAFEGAIRKLGHYGGYACYEMDSDNLGENYPSSYFVMVS